MYFQSVKYSTVIVACHLTPDSVCVCVCVCVCACVRACVCVLKLNEQMGTCILTKNVNCCGS